MHYWWSTWINTHHHPSTGWFLTWRMTIHESWKLVICDPCFKRESIARIQFAHRSQTVIAPKKRAISREESGLGHEFLQRLQDHWWHWKLARDGGGLCPDATWQKDSQIFSLGDDWWTVISVCYIYSYITQLMDVDPSIFQFWRSLGVWWIGCQVFLIHFGIHFFGGPKNDDWPGDGGIPYGM